MTDKANSHSPQLSASQTPDGRYRLLVENITDYAIYMLDPDGTIASWNAGAEKFKGYGAGEVIGKHFSIFYTEEDRASGLPFRALLSASREGRFEQEGWRVRKDGSRFWANVIVDPIWDDGQLVGYAKITRDLTERRKAEEALRKSQEEFRILVQGVTDYAIYMLDPHGNVSNWNLGAERIKGYSPNEIIGRHFSNFYTIEDRAADEPTRALQTALNEGRYIKEGWRVRKDGTRFWANVLIDTIRAPDGELIGFAKVTRDISDQRERQIQLEKTQDALRQSQKMEAVGQLTGGVAHDFNNLLTIIHSSVDFLRRPGLSEERKTRYINAIADTVARASKLTSQLLSFARRQVLKPETFDVGEQVRSVVSLVQPLVGGLININLNVCHPACFAVADVSQFETALVNLAVNARDAMNGEGEITIDIAHASGIPAVGSHAGRAGDYIAVSLRDQGVGIPTSKIDQIFEPFFTTKQVGQGTGLGLSQVFGFAKQSGGEIHVESEPGKGANFTLYLPRSHSSSIQADGYSSEARSQGNGERILVVEDNEAVREFSTEMLRDLGYAIEWAADGKTALEKLSQQSFNLVFSDVVMPGMNGVELAHMVKKIHPGLPIILTSGYSDVLAEDANHGFELIKKPYSADALSRILSRAMKRSR